MGERVEVTDTVDVPPNTGLEGFIRVMRHYLRMPRVREINIDSRGKITVSRYVSAEENAVISVDFSNIQPYHVIRNTLVTEISISDSMPASTAICKLFESASVAQLYPIAFASGINTLLWSWFMHTTHMQLMDMKSLYGVPVYLDRELPDTALVLIAGTSRDDNVAEAHSSFKLEMTITHKSVEVF